MSGDCFLVLGLGSTRSTWFRALGAWANSGAIPVDLVKCLSAEEVRAQLESGRAYSALVADAGMPAVDRDLLAATEAAGCATLVVEDPRCPRDWSRLAVTRVLPRDFGRDELVGALQSHARRVVRASPERAGRARPPAGRLVAVTGPGGTGSSTAAMALAQTLGDRSPGSVLLADLCLDAELAMLHDAGDVTPGLQELVEAHRGEPLSPAAVHSMVFGVPDRGYMLLLGLRRSRNWPVLRPRAVSAALDSLQHTFEATVADVDCDVEGESQGGSIDVEERNVLARTACSRAEAVLAVGIGSMKGVHSLVRVIDSLVELGVPPARIVPVVNRSPRSGRARAAITAAVAELAAPRLGPDGGAELCSPIFLPERSLEVLSRDGARLPAVLGKPLAGAVDGVGRRRARQRVPEPAAGGYEPVLPGTLGTGAR